jgi:peroxiredoxin family protein
MKAAPAQLVVFLHAGEYDRVHQGLAIAAAAAASGKRVDVYLFWWALERFLADRLDDPDFPAEHAEAADRFERRGMPTLRALISHLRDSGLCAFYACTGSLAVVEEGSPPSPPWLAGWMGWATILERTQGIADRFYL